MRFLPLLLVASLLSTNAASAGEEAASVPDALEAHLARHPEFETADVYKFLHQAIYGPGHAIPDRETAVRYLAHEVAGLGPPLEGEVTCEELGGEPVLVRVNLRPFLAANRDNKALLDAFVAAANEVHGDPDRMEKAIAGATEVLVALDRRDLADELREVAEDHAGKGFPAIHHSERYRDAYAPAYRVVTRAAATEHGWCE